MLWRKGRRARPPAEPGTTALWNLSSMACRLRSAERGRATVTAKSRSAASAAVVDVATKPRKWL